MNTGNVRNYCVMITSTVMESVWVLASDDEQALSIARFIHCNGTTARFEVDRKVTNTEVIGLQEVLQ